MNSDDCDITPKDKAAEIQCDPVAAAAASSEKRSIQEIDRNGQQSKNQTNDQMFAPDGFHQASFSPPSPTSDSDFFAQLNPLEKKPDEIRLAQTSDHLSDSWTVGHSCLFPGSSASRRTRRRRQLDRIGFPRPYLLELYHSHRYSCPLEFNCFPVISQGGSASDSLWRFCDFVASLRYGHDRFGETSPFGYLKSIPSVDGEPQSSFECD